MKFELDPKRIVTLNDGIDAESINKVQEKIIKLHIEDPDKWISLVINSGGGNTDLALFFCEMMTKVLKPKLITVALAEVSSAAIVIYMAGQHRIASVNCKFFLHETIQLIEEDEEFDIKKTKFMIQNLRHRDKVYAEFISAQSEYKIKVAEVLDFMHKETYLSAQQLLKHGIAHEII